MKVTALVLWAPRACGSGLLNTAVAKVDQARGSRPYSRCSLKLTGSAVIWVCASVVFVVVQQLLHSSRLELAAGSRLPAWQAPVGPSAGTPACLSA